FAVPVHGLHLEPADDQATRIRTAVYELANRSFDLARGPLFRFDLLKLSGAGEGQFVLVACLHHIIADGLSLNLLIRELVLLYASSLQGAAAPLPALPVQYVDYAHWQRQRFSGDKLASELEFWRQQVKDVPSLLALPTDRPRPPIQTTRGTKYYFDIEPATATALSAFCQAQGLTVFMGLMAGLQMVLSRHANQCDFCIGMPTAGRNQKEVEQLIGFFVNGVLVRADLNGNPTWSEHLSRVKQRLLDVFSHQDMPAQLLFDRLNIPRNPAYPPLAQVGFQLQNFSTTVQGGEQDKAMLDTFQRMTRLTMEPIRLEEAESKFDMIISAVQNGAALSGYVEYNTDLFDESTIARIVRHWQTALDSMLSGRDDRIENVVLEPETELRHQLKVADDEQLLPVTSTHVAFLRDMQLRPSTRQYAVGFRYAMHFAVDQALLRQAIHQVNMAHVALRARFVACDLPWAEPYYMVIAAHDPVQVEALDLPSDVVDQDAFVEEHFDRWCYRNHDVFAPDLVKLQIVNGGPERHWLLFSTHHIILDGIGGHSYLHKILRCYEGLVRGEPHVMQDGYAAFIPENRAEMDQPATLNWWRQQAQNVVPMDFSLPRHWQTSSQYQILSQPLGQEQWGRVREFCRRNKTHPSIFFRLLAALLLKQYCRPEGDFVLFDMQSGRGAGQEADIGVFYQQVPFIIELGTLKDDCSAKDFFGQQRDFRRAIRDYQQISLAAQNRLLPAGRIAFQFNYFNFLQDAEVCGYRAFPYTFSSHVDNTLQIFVKDYGNEGAIELWFDGSVFVPLQLIERMVSLIDQFAATPDLKFGELEYCLPSERDAEALWNDTAAPVHNTPTAVHWFEESVRRFGSNTAVIHRDRTLTYDELNRQANRLARHLRQLGLQRGERVGICHGRSADLLTAVWAVLKAGGTYIPIEASYPQDRINYILRDSNARLLLTETCIAKRLPDFTGTALLLDQLDAELAQHDDSNLDNKPRPEDGIYIIYTSGSTGNPKGAALHHAGEVNLQQWYTEACEFGPADRTILVSAFGFDLTQKNLFGPLLCGGAVVVPAMDEYDAEVVAAEIARSHATHINCAPSAFYALVEHLDEARAQQLQTLRWVYLGGEPIRMNALYTWLQHPTCKAQVVNSYGPTECTDVVSWEVLDAINPSSAGVPIGRPICNTQIHILNDALRPAPHGVAGEICITGAGVGLGYVERDELTAQVFVSNPYGAGKLYRTGDLGRFMPDGRIEYIGRKDFQVKVRGLRIELGEIEHAIRQLPEIADALVMVKQERLVAYAVTTQPNTVLNWQAPLRNALPDYMVPARLILLPEWPLTPNGKIDRKALPDPDLQQRNVPFAAPRDDIEIAIADIWSQLLKKDGIGIHDSFFDLGGHSLLANQIVSRLRKHFAVALPIRDLMVHPTVAELAQRVRMAQKNQQLAALTPCDRTQRIPLSIPQQRLWLLDQIEPGNAAYHVPSIIRINGALDIAALEQAFCAVINRHEGLRAVFAEDEQGPHQLIQPEQDWKIQHQVSDASNDEDALRKQVAGWVLRPFDLAQGPLFRAVILEQARDRFILVVVLHHIITDGWSNGILVRDLAQAYAQLKSSGRPSFAPLPLQYADFAAWQRAVLSQDTLTQKMAFWRERLSDVPALELPTDFRRPPVQTFRGASARLELSADTAEKLQQLGAGTQSTLFMVLLAAYSALLQKYSGQEDFCVGTPVAGRDRPELETMVGFFVNTLALRVMPQPTMSFRQLLDTVRDTALNSFEHQDVPFEQIVEDINPLRDMSRSPLFQVMMVYQNLPVDNDTGLQATQLGDIELAPFALDIETAKFEQTLTLWPQQNGIGGALTYNADLFEAETARRFVRQFERLCTAIATNPDLALHQINVLDRQESHTQLIEWNRTGRDYDRDLCVHNLIHQSAQKHANTTAIRCGDESLTHAELDRLSSRIAHQLVSNGVGPGDHVGVALDRNLHLMTAILGILKSGAAYVPIDAAYPEERIRYILGQGGIRVLITRQHLTPNLPSDVEWLLLDEAVQASAVPTSMPTQINVSAADWLYVIFTSGSTGKPKGTGAYHRSEVNLLQWYCDEFRLQSTDRILLLSAIGFDLTQKNLFAPLVSGATLVIPDFQEYDPTRIVDLIEREGITWINCAPSAFYPLVDNEQDWPKLASLRQVFLGGEPINLARLSAWLKQSNCELVNSYGPTECADIAAYHRIALEADLIAPVLPIGRPNYNVQLFVLGEHRELLPIGAVGELYISGDGVGPGYLNNPELTAQVFTPNPHLEGQPLMYRTGDRVRYRKDGVVEYLGRRDHQIKLRGFRVEAGEIQTLLNQHTNVKDSLVDVLKSDAGADQLVAWIHCRELPADLPAFVHELKQRAEQFLPRFMVPDAWLPLAVFPLTPNGKVDRKALPKPQWQQRSTPFIDPRNATEAALAQIWQDVLRIDRVGVTDNFFELGGHSLLATQVASRVRRQLGVAVQIRDLMLAPTIEAMAARIDRSEREQQEPAIVPVDRSQRLPLSFAQQRLWLLDRIEPGSVAYNVPSVIRIRGALDAGALEKALSKLFNRHEGLRATFLEDEQGPYQQILPVQDWKLPLIQVEDDGFAHQEVELKRLAAIELMTPFDMARGPLFRARLFRLNDREHVFAVVIHHIVTDGWSMNLLIRDLANAYVQISTHGDVYFEPAPLQYADFAAWQRARLTDSLLGKWLGYWKDTLADVPALNLPTDFKRPPVQTYNGASVRFTVPANTRTQLAALAQQENASLFMGLLSAFAVLLQRYSGQTDFCIGTPVAGRDRSELESMVGFFVNTLAIRTQAEPLQSFRQLLQQVKARVLDGFAHQEVPFEQIVEAVDPARDMSRSPLFQVMLAYQNLPVEQTNTGALANVGDIQLEPYNPGVDAAKYDLTLTLWDEAGGLGGTLQYNTDLFAEHSMQAMMQHFSGLLACLAQQPDAAITVHRYLSQDETEQQLVEWNLTARDYDKTLSLPEWFDSTAERYGNSIAVVCGQQQLTYAELKSQSNQFAHYLRQRGVQPGDRVAVCLDRSLHLMTAILGVIKAGATYVPLDAGYPEERLRYILDNAQIKIGVTREHLTANLPVSVQWIQWESAQPEITAQSIDAPQVPHDPERLLYVIFTSGSTGKPKGTSVYHHSEINLLDWYLNQFGMQPSDRFLLLSAVGFDLTQKSLFGPLVCGATLVIPEFQEYDISAIQQLIEQEKITWINCAPSAFYPLQDELQQWTGLASLRYLFLGGEPINLPRLAGWLRQSRCQLVNSYGPTECTDIAAWYAIDVERDISASALPIGRPNYNVRLYVLGDQQELLPIGAIGELYIGGEGVGPGYLNNAELTAQAFLPNPYQPGDRIYRTGDRVRYRPDGVVEYLGRRDHQMKLRGYRIEAGEIQAVINQTPGVKDSLVDIITAENGVQRLVAWVMTDARAEQAVNAAQLSQRAVDTVQLSQRALAFLPAFMVPEAWVLLENFPLTPNGKVDRKALPKPDLDSGRDYVAPRTPLEISLSTVWAGVLGVERVGVHDNFFQLGGQSLLATQLVSRLSRQFSRTFSVRALFENPTIETFAKVVEQAGVEPSRPAIVARRERHQARLSFGQQRLWFFEQLNPGTSANNMPMALKIRGALREDALQKAFRELIRRHESLRTHFAAGADGEPVQIITQSVDWRMALVDLSTLPVEQREAPLQQQIEKNRSDVFDLRQAPLLRATLVKANEAPEYYLLFCMHHIVSDGASLIVLFRELVTLYLAFSHDAPSPLPELRLHYGDFAEWQRDWLSAERMNDQMQYWQNKLAKAPALLELPLDKARPPVQSTAGASVNVQFPASFGARLQAVCAEQGITPFMFLLTGWKLLLARYSGQRDILIGVPTLGRHTPELENLIGFFIQSLVLRTDLGQNPTVAQAVQRVRQTVLEGFSNGDVPVDLIVERLGIRRNPAYSPLVQVAFQLLDNASFNAGNLLQSGQFGDLQVEVLGGATTTAKFDLTLNLTQNGDQFAGSLEYNTTLFFDSTVQRLLQHYVRLCDLMLDSQQAPVETLAFSEPQSLLAELGLDTSQFETAVPLSAMQYDMFLDNLVNPTSLQSSHGWHIHIHRELDVDLWRDCIQTISDQQPVMRARFVA
ncbi:MAG TPA: amino acid adenylation domain-containing protein, partial [Dongiaceae bacterium]|nr:amino acid adenylation domain-containing protein [Dongiaceae bacterium]